MNNPLKRSSAFFTLVFVGLMSLTAAAQLSSDKLFEEFYGKKGVTSYVINKSMLQLFTDASSSEDSKEFKDLVSQIDKIVIMTVESDSENPNRSSDFYKKTKGAIPKTFKQLMQVKKETEMVTIYMDEKNDKVREVIMLISEPKNTVLMSISGDLDLVKLAELSEKMNISGFENLNSIDRK
jgi:hypothetical protein